MKTIKLFNLIILCSVIFGTTLFADGLLVTNNTKYPTLYLKNKVTEVNVTINGIIAETVVTQEFENEWYKSVDGVYSFPLPADARSIRLLYSVGDTMIDAILKVQPQSTNPGTGSGGVVAEINKYMGSNAIRIQLTNIPAHGIKVIELHYISILSQYNGKYNYHYPFNTSSFLKDPLDFLRINIKVNSSKKISSFELESHTGAKIVSSDDNNLELKYSSSKVFAAKDILFNYSVENSLFDIDLYSCKPDTSDGYFTLVGHPQIQAGDSVLPSSIIFLFGNSSGMIGSKLDQSKIALSLSLDRLNVRDSFNIVLFNSRTIKWKNGLVRATGANITAAKEYVSGITGEFGSNLQDGILKSLEQLSEKEGTSSILVFSDGRGMVDPFSVEKFNDAKVGIFFIAIGNDVDRARLETVASLNYGFVTYLSEDNLLGIEMANILDKISKPLMKNVEITYDNPEINSLYPLKATAIFAGSDFIQTGRYKFPGFANIIFDGYGKNDSILIKYIREFSDTSSDNEIGRKLWVKYAIDQLEAQILIYGEQDSLKEKLINLSLGNNMRCRYTAYTQDTLYVDGSGDPDGDPGSTSILNIKSDSKSSGIILNYPNPFSYSTVLKFYISNMDCNKTKIIKIYDTNGRLIKAINISDFIDGEHELTINTSTESVKLIGVYFLVLEIDSKIRSNIKICISN